MERGLRPAEHRAASIEIRDRHLTACPHRPPCGACPRFGEPGISAGALEGLAALRAEHGLAATAVINGPTTAFRLRARLAVRGRLGAPKIGLFEPGTHRVVHVPACSVQHPLINEVAAVVRRALADARVTCYSDQAHQGLARYLQVVIERSSQTAQVVLVANSATAEPLAACLELIRARLGDSLHSLWFNAHTARSNAVLGARFEHWCGPESVVERFGGAAVHYPPGAFGQSNLDIAERIIEHVRSLLPTDARVAEFYAGVGAIGLSLGNAVTSLCMNESAVHSLRGLELGVAALDPVRRSAVTVVPGPAAAACRLAAGAQVVIADPPRKGLDVALLAALAADPPERFVYVSCSLGSLRADARRLTATGSLRLVGLSPFNLIPFTDHVETVAWFERGPRAGLSVS